VGIYQHYSSFTDDEEDDEDQEAADAGDSRGNIQKNRVKTTQSSYVDHVTKRLNPESQHDGVYQPSALPNRFIVPEDEDSPRRKILIQERGHGRQLSPMNMVMVPVMAPQNIEVQQQYATLPMQQQDQRQQPVSLLDNHEAPVQIVNSPPAIRNATAGSSSAVAKDDGNDKNDGKSLWQEDMNMEDMYWTGKPIT